MDDNIINWLQKWTISQVNGDWEHELGVSITMLDNPGWILCADISEYFDFVLNSVPTGGKLNNDWLDYYIIAKEFSAYLYINGDLKKLNHLLYIFRGIIQELEKIKNEGKGILTVDRIKYIVDNVSNELLDTPAGTSL